MEGQTAKFEGWALVELFGHGREAGFVATEYFGGTALFRVDVPDIPARQEAKQAPCWVDGRLVPAGTVTEEAAIPGRTRYIGPGAIYAINPATEEAVRAAVARVTPRKVKVISLPEGMALPQPARTPGEDDGEEGEF